MHSPHPFSIFISFVCYQLHSRLLLFNLIIVATFLCLVFYVVKHLRVIFWIGRCANSGIIS
jgi:hypothetical protein